MFNRYRDGLVTLVIASILMLASCAPDANRQEDQTGSRAFVISASPMVNVPPSVGHFRRIGRFEPQKDESILLSWPGSGIEISFTGNKLELEMEDGGYGWYDLDVNGQVKPMLLNSGVRNYTIVNSEETQEHKVRLIRRVDGTEGETRLINIRIDGPLHRFESPERRLLVMGDSFSAGYGAEGIEGDCKRALESHNHFAGWVGQLAGLLDLDVHNISSSRRAMLTDDGLNQTTELEWYDRAVEGKEGSTWDMQAWRPDAVILHLGHKDFEKGSPIEPFADAYEKLIADLVNDYPGVRIYPALGPIRSPEVLESAEAAIELASQKIFEGHKDLDLPPVIDPEAGPNLTYLNFEIDDAGYEGGCAGQPGRGGHFVIAQLVARQLAEDLDWELPAELRLSDETEAETETEPDTVTTPD